MDIFFKAMGFVIFIAIGHFIKRVGMCTVEHGRFLSKVIMNITLPCALVASMNNLEIHSSMLVAMLCGFLGNVITVVSGYILMRKDSKINQGIMLINTSGYNIGAFTLPFVQLFFPLSYISYVCLFDTGNAIMCLGGSYTVASLIVNRGGKINWFEIIKRLFSSVPFCVYIVLFALALLHISIPEQIVAVTNIAGNANAFLAMLMIGILLDFDLDLGQVKLIAKIMINRYFWMLLFSLFVYFLLPIDLVIKKVIVFCFFAPVASMAPVFSTRLGSDSPVPAAVNSISIIVSIVVFVTLIMFFI